MRELKPGVFFIAALDKERELFDEIIPLPDGTSYNSYLIKAEKTALVDGVDPTKKQELLSVIKDEKIDFVICNHAEQDHSGAIPDVLELFPKAKVVTNEKCKQMLMDHLLISEERFLVVKDREELALGGKTLQFFLAAWVHWPETMFTLVKEDSVLLTCDFLGSHLATEELYADMRTIAAAKRYYAEIMMPFRTIIKKHLALLDGLKPEIIGPSHGPVWNQPSLIIDAYKDWVSDEPKDLAMLIYVSMHGSTQAIAYHMQEALKRKGIKVSVFNLTAADMGALTMALVDASTLIVASPTFLVGPHPTIVNTCYLINALRPKTKLVSVIESHGWAGKAAEKIKELLGGLDTEWTDPISIKGHPKPEDLKLIDNLAETIANRQKKKE